MEKFQTWITIIMLSLIFSVIIMVVMHFGLQFIHYINSLICPTHNVKIPIIGFITFLMAIGAAKTLGAGESKIKEE